MEEILLNLLKIVLQFCQDPSLHGLSNEVEDIALKTDPDFVPLRQFTILAIDDVLIYQCWGCNSKKLAETPDGHFCGTCKRNFLKESSGTFSNGRLLVEEMVWVLFTCTGNLAVRHLQVRSSP